MRVRMALAVGLLLAANGGCGSGDCSFQLLERLAVEGTVQCCGGSFLAVVSIRHDEAEADLAFAKAEGPPPPAHAWLTTPDCAQLFEGSYPTSPPLPLCPVFLGPVAPGEVGPRQKLPRGSYRVWVQAFSGSAEPLRAFVDVGVWGERCGGL